MWEKRLVIFSDSNVSLNIINSEGKPVPIDDLSDINIVDNDLNKSVSKVLGNIFKIDPNEIRLSKGKINRKNGYRWEAKLSCPVSTTDNSFDSIHLEIGPNPTAEITFFKQGEYYKDVENVLENEELKSNLRELTKILTKKEDLNTGTVFHRYYNDGSGHSGITF
jgi:hypothetical protein